MISREHAKIVQLEERDEAGNFKWKISDINSINGVFVNNVKVNDAVLE